jgi:hypothetical protein
MPWNEAALSTAQVEERFSKLFGREMTVQEREALFLWPLDLLPPKETGKQDRARSLA